MRSLKDLHREMAIEQLTSFWSRNTTLRLGVKITLAALTLLFLWYASFTIRLRREPLVPIHVDRDDFVHRWLETSLLEPFTASAIRGYCDTVEWRSNLIFNLLDANGGIGNVRAHFLDYFFYAMEAGAAIILPSTAVRKEDNLYDVWGGEGRAPFSRMWDEAWFKSALKEACPQMRIYEQPNDPADLGEHISDVFMPQSPVQRKDTNRRGWLDNTNVWLGEHGYMGDRTTPYVVDTGRTMWHVDTRKLSPLLRKNFGMLLRINPEVRRFAAIAISNLAAVYGVRLNPSDRVHKNAYYGAHLRTESDAVDAGYTEGNCDSQSCPLNFDAQTDHYISAARSAGLRTIFAASGNQTEIEHFRAKGAASSPPMIVVDKWDLLSPEEGKKLSDYHWDVQALVDYEIMMRCSVFGSIAQSSFGWTIAIARTVWMEKELGYVGDPYFMESREALRAFDNGLNTLVGRNYFLEREAPVMFP